VPYVPDGQDAPNGIACNTQDGGYAIGVTKLTAAQGYTTVGLVTNSAGVKVAPVFNLSRPNFGAQATPAYNHVSNTYYISYEGSAGVVGKEVSAAGSPLTGEETIVSALGSIRDNVLAIRTDTGEYLQFAIGDNGQAKSQRFTTCTQTGSPSSITNLTATAGVRQIELAWTNPSECYFRGSMIRYRTDTFPTSITDGNLAVDKPRGEGSTDSYVHTGLSASLTYYYAVFAHDDASHFSPVAHASAMSFATGDFNRDRDVDQEDFGHIQACMASPADVVPPECADADFDSDLNVNSEDLDDFLGCFSAPAQLPGC
jgi:hypothetical protein